MRYIDGREDPVDVRDAVGRRHPGILHAWRLTQLPADRGNTRHAAARWQGWVKYTVGVAGTHNGWFDQADLRPATWHYPDKPQPRQD